MESITFSNGVESNSGYISYTQIPTDIAALLKKVDITRLPAWVPFCIVLLVVFVATCVVARTIKNNGSLIKIIITNVVSGVISYLTVVFVGGVSFSMLWFFVSLLTGPIIPAMLFVKMLF